MSAAVASAPAVDTDYVNLTVLWKRTGLSRLKLSTMALTGKIRSIVEPGEKPLYSLSDALAAARERRGT